MFRMSLSALAIGIVLCPDPTLSDKYEVDLYKYLMNYDRYEPAVRPTLDHRSATNVTFGFLLHQVINVDEKNQQLTTSSWMNVNWMDRRLSWNYSQWGGVKILHIPHHKVWKPDLILTNNADPEYKEAVVSTDVFVTPEGNVTWLYFAIYQSACQIRVRFYPFDDQECSLTFASWSYDGNSVNLLLLTEEGDLSNYVNSSEWAILKMTAHRRVQKFSVGNALWPVITITIHLGRRPLFYVFNHIIPCVLISAMSMLGFYIPAETGEKVTMCITTLLSMGVFLKTITENMPPSSEAVPLIGMYYVVSLFIVCAATVVNVVTLNVHNRGSKNSPSPVPNWARKFILGHMANWLCLAVYPTDVQMFHLAEKRRQIGDDEKLLNEIALAHFCSQNADTIIPTCEPNGATANIQRVPDIVGLGKVAPKARANCRAISRSRSCAVGTHTPTPLRPSFSVACERDRAKSPACRTRSIYDSNYELESLRKLNAQARLITGALNLMQAPLDGDALPPKPNSPRQLAPPNCSWIGKNRLSIVGDLLPNNVDHKLEKQIPRREEKRSTNEAESSHLRKEGSPVTVAMKSELEKHFCNVLKKVHQTLEQNELRISLQDERAQIMWEWKQLAIIVDRTLLLLFVFATGFTTFMILFERTIFDDQISQNDDVPPVI